MKYEMVETRHALSPPAIWFVYLWLHALSPPAIQGWFHSMLRALSPLVMNGLSRRYRDRFQTQKHNRNEQ